MIKNKQIKEIIVSAGKIIEKYYDSEIKIDYKKDGSPVTIADTNTDSFLKEELLKLFPQASWLSEETKDNKRRLSSDFVWIVDPLDGTKEFSERIPHVSISIALIEKNKPVLGAVYNPITKEGGIVSKWEKPYFWNIGETNNVDDTKEFFNLLTTVSRSESKRGDIKEFSNKMDYITPIGSVAYKLLLVAANKYDLYFSIAPKSEWDICGGVALLELTNKTYKLFNNQKNVFNQNNTLVKSGAVGGKEKYVNEFLEVFKKEINQFQKKLD